jgi:hypothetical protein
MRTLERLAGPVLAFLLLAGVGAAGPAVAGASFGVRGGYADVDEAAFTGSGRIGGTPLFGLQVMLPVLPLVSLVIAGEQRSNEFDFGDANFGDLHLRGRAKWTDQTLFAAGRVAMPGVLGLYGGAGVGLHRRKTKVSQVVEVGKLGAGSPADDPLSDFRDRVQKESNDLSWHGFAGVELRLPVVPVSVFAEGRIDDIQGAAPHSLAAYAGVNLRLP